MALGLDSQLDAPPPSPKVPSLGQMAGPMGQTPMVPGMGASGGMGGGVPPTDPSGMPTKPIVDGIMDAGVQMGLMLDDFARATPQFAQLLEPVKQALQAYLGALTAAGAGPTGPTATGSPFPGGGLGRGPMPL